MSFEYKDFPECGKTIVMIDKRRWDSYSNIMRLEVSLQFKSSYQLKMTIYLDTILYILCVDVFCLVSLCLMLFMNYVFLMYANTLVVSVYMYIYSVYIKKSQCVHIK